MVKRYDMQSYDETLLLNIKSIVETKNSILFVQTNVLKYENVINLFKRLKFNHVCYVTLNKTYDILARSLGSKGVDIRKFYFIDGITSVILKPKSRENTLFLNSQSVDEVKSELNELLKRKTDILVIDSISSLLVYNSSKEVLSFIEGILKNVSLKNTKILLLVLKKDWGEIKKLESLVDSVIII